MSEPLLRTLFTGGNLFGVGAQAAGWRDVEGFEFDPKIAAVARRNGYHVHTADVCNVAYEALRPVRHLHASPSCRTASRANANSGETPEDLASADAVCRAIRAHAAQGGRSFTLENVYGYRWYESYDRICATLRECGFVFDARPKGGTKPAWRTTAPVWADAGHFVNMADFGVPQTRERLILIAVRADWRPRPPGLRPTHGRRGGLMLERWNGWWGAVADIAHTFPETQPAAWQEKRLPAELRESLLVEGTQGGASNAFALPMRGPSEPCFTVRAAMDKGMPRAYLLDSKNTGQEYGKLHRADEEPSISITADPKPSHRPVALLLATNSNPSAEGGNNRWSDEPAQTATGNAEGRVRALLLGDQSASAGEGVLSRWGDDPAMTVRAGRRERGSAHVGRWVRITLQGLGRLQTVPDDYIGLTSQINGNGVPPRFARILMEALHA